ncbi:MAG: transcription antitermination factor NusB [Pseudomonadota bacterium]|uniref:Transcription antitermination protein NusB n=1 Tax=Gallaecimonas pentaromativorans TaxID=584787 RepID=A0A3N1NUF3_9GAMM|nr:transcription antitermination factor NusB [Gallaecimonas pentaromativorans]MED5525041.1 transcription antitermination factor NusB [Pseudomonadota bacterium]ROQ18838.1 NusB antitermination factor [Gallaecimonas pentaromativorans]
MKPAFRRKARRLALQAIYQWQMTKDPIAEVEHQFLTEQDMNEVDVDYFRDLIVGVATHTDELDTILTRYVSRPLDDVDLVEKAALRLGLYELTRRKDVPYKVALNEAIELAKTFAAEDSHKFVNGVLDKFIRDQQGK